jgi:hypothetical protein
MAVRLAKADSVILGLLEIARLAMPDTFWQTDSRVNAARKHLGKKFPKEEQ